MANRTKLNSKGMAELLKSAGVRADLTRRMERVADKGRSAAPVASGDYKDHIEVFQATTDRAVVRAGSTSDHALQVEVHTGNMTRALDAAGGD